jgi:hypothetical protein
MSTYNLQQNYVRAMCEPVIEGSQDANVMFVTESELSAVLPLIEQFHVQSQVHMPGDGVAIVYIYGKQDVVRDLVQLSRLTVEQPDYYYRAGSLLGYDQPVIQECIENHPETFVQKLAPQQ